MATVKCIIALNWSLSFLFEKRCEIECVISVLQLFSLRTFNRLFNLNKIPVGPFR